MRKRAPPYEVDRARSPKRIPPNNDKADKVKHPIESRRRAKRELRRDGVVRVKAKITFKPTAVGRRRSAGS